MDSIPKTEHTCIEAYELHFLDGVRGESLGQDDVSGHPLPLRGPKEPISFLDLRCFLGHHSAVVDTNVNPYRDLGLILRAVYLVGEVVPVCDAVLVWELNSDPV